MDTEKARRIADRLIQYENEERAADQRHAAKQFSTWNWYGKPLLGFMLTTGVVFSVLYWALT